MGEREEPFSVSSYKDSNPIDSGLYTRTRFLTLTPCYFKYSHIRCPKHGVCLVFSALEEDYQRAMNVLKATTQLVKMGGKLYTHLGQ